MWQRSCSIRAENVRRMWSNETNERFWMSLRQKEVKYLYSQTYQIEIRILSISFHCGATCRRRSLHLKVPQIGQLTAILFLRWLSKLLWAGHDWDPSEIELRLLRVLSSAREIGTISRWWSLVRLYYGFPSTGAMRSIVTPFLFQFPNRNANKLSSRFPFFFYIFFI